LITPIPVRATLARATGSFFALSALTATAVGGAYIAGSLARASVEHAKIERIAGAARQGFSEHALEAAADHDASAMAIARRFDNLDAPVATDREERVAAFADSLEARREGAAPAARVMKASFTSTTTAADRPLPTPARPFHLRGALDESRDLECLTQAVYYEARGESAAGQAAVAQVVLNRTRHPAFPKTVCGVVFQGVRGGGCQFSFACDGSVHRRVESYAWRRAEQVAAKALDGQVMAGVGNATHFHVASLSPAWGPRLLRVAQVGAHVFYRFSGRGGSAGAFNATPEPSQPVTTAMDAKPVYASLALAPIANSVATSVAEVAAAGAELVMAAAGPKAVAAPRPAETAAPLVKPAPLGPLPPAPATTAPAAAPAPQPAAAPAPVASAETKPAV
jgi:spore germination cell wall hydrolase CwlJ-like protein